MARGGYRKPANPAPVSGPGAMSRRTDGAQPVMNIPSSRYGEGEELRQLQSGATMKQQETAPAAAKVTGLFEPTQRPKEPTTAGMPFGPGPNRVTAPGMSFKPSVRDVLTRALEMNDDPDLETIYNVLLQRGVI